MKNSNDGKAAHVAKTRNGTNINSLSPSKSKHPNKALPEKEFKVRNSLLTDVLLSNKEMQAVHSIILAVFVHFVVYSAVKDLITTGSIDLGVANLKRMFGKPFLTFSILAGLHLMPILVMYPIFRLWTSLRIRSTSKSLKSILDTALFICLGNIFLATFYVPCEIHFVYDRIPLACSGAVVLEQLRILMKMYAFIRTNFPRAHRHNHQLKSHSKTPPPNKVKELEINKKPSELRQRRQALDSSLGESESDSENTFENQDGSKFKYFDDNVACPDYEKFLYFMYAPTLIYRDSYPRNTLRRWSFIFGHTLHATGSILFYSLLHERIGYVVLQDFGPKNPMTINELLIAFSYQIAVGSVGYILAWAILLHSVQNIFGELLRFGDRGFYKDWYTAVSYSEYHRKWNEPVHGFLYTYVYKEACQYGLGKIMAALLVFSVSNLFHEYAISFVTQFFCPVMGIMFGFPGTFLTFIQNKHYPQAGNIFMHWSMGVGVGLIHSFYTLEYFARANGCPSHENPIKDFFIPRLISCDAFRWN